LDVNRSLHHFLVEGEGVADAVLLFDAEVLVVVVFRFRRFVSGDGTLVAVCNGENLDVVLVGEFVD
jgi:hypothetical protein